MWFGCQTFGMRVCVGGGAYFLIFFSKRKKLGIKYIMICRTENRNCKKKKIVIYILENKKKVTYYKLLRKTNLMKNQVTPLSQTR